MFLRRVAQTAGAFATVAFCADKITDSGPRFQRQISVPEKQATFRTYAKDVDDRAYQLFRATDWKEYQTAKVMSNSLVPPKTNLSSDIKIMYIQKAVYPLTVPGGGFLVQRSIRGRAAEMGLKIGLLV